MVSEPKVLSLNIDSIIYLSFQLKHKKEDNEEKKKKKKKNELKGLLGHLKTVEGVV
jgi:hypothetical protein